ncbi:MAG TPA: hypothetical protein VFE36_07545 [Candidatus Baltobacteraceae bacterium]|jgi:hypothetical protein|nr:hypothetical protein [Candidatus Baltobacteraceae bacterium]
MKTFAVVLSALVATAAPAVAHGGGSGGAPVMAPGAPTVVQPIAPIGQPVMTPVTVPWTRDFPSSHFATTPDRKHRRSVSQFVGADYAQICNSAMRTPTVIQVYEVKGGPPVCGQDVITQNGMLALPPAFVW